MKLLVSANGCVCGLARKRRSAEKLTRQVVRRKPNGMRCSYRPPNTLPKKNLAVQFYRIMSRPATKSRFAARRTITARACVMLGPGFRQMHSGDVIVQHYHPPPGLLLVREHRHCHRYGGPLSTQSIVAREYGILPCWDRRGTRRIKDGQTITWTKAGR